MLMCETDTRVSLLSVGGGEAEKVGWVDFYMGADMHGGSGSQTRWESKHASCNLNSIMHPPRPWFFVAYGAGLNHMGVSSSSPAQGSSVSVWASLGSRHLLLLLLDIIPPAEQKGREEGNFNSTPEWRVSYNQCIQACITGCHWDSITHQHRGGGRMGY